MNIRTHNEVVQNCTVQFKTNDKKTENTLKACYYVVDKVTNGVSNVFAFQIHSICKNKIIPKKMINFAYQCIFKPRFILYVFVGVFYNTKVEKITIFIFKKMTKK